MLESNIHLAIMRLLLVEDDRGLSEFVEEGLAREGFSVDLAQNGDSALELAGETAYDVILLDVMMPGQDGYTVLKKLRAKGHQGAILLVTSKGQERDKLEGLNNGADDYLVKPFLLTELIARVRAVLRRTGKSGPTAPIQGSVLKVGDLQMDLLKHEVKTGGKPIVLTKKEFDLLECFMRRPGQVLSQTVLMQQLSNADFVGATNIIEVHIKNLRSKIDGKSGKSMIRTVRGCGYSLDS
jgi:two-component system copper resistance phosphate regulon response regulator CusR